MYNKIQMGIEGNKKQKEGTILMKEIRTEDAVGTFCAMTSHRLSKM